MERLYLFMRWKMSVVKGVIINPLCHIVTSGLSKAYCNTFPARESGRCVSLRKKFIDRVSNLLWMVTIPRELRTV